MLPGFVYIPTGTIDEDRLYFRNRVTDTYLRGEALQAPAIALVVQKNAIEAVGLLERGAAVTSFQRRIVVTAIELVSEAPAVASVIGRVPVRLRQHAGEVFQSGGPVSPATWQAVRKALEQVPSVARLISRLESRAAPPRWVTETNTRPRQLVEQEQDAVGLALSLGGLERDALESWEPGDEPAPFLSGIDHLELREDQLLINDMLVFGRWNRTDANGLWAEFSDRAGHRVTVMNVNRHPLESTLGVDLIYYSHKHQAFTLVQYKRMRWENHGPRAARQPVYRPAHDKNLAGQLERMREVETGIETDPALQMAHYRLARGTCFLKVCHPDLELGGAELSKGMYMDLDLWSLALAYLTPPDGNPSFTFDKRVRYLNNTEFIGLVRQGWIGSRGIMSAKIQGYISQSLNGRHSVTLATASG